MAIAFAPVVDAAASTLVVSAAANVSGLTLGSKTVQIISPSGELSVNGRAWATTDTVQNGDSIRLRVTTPNSELGEVTTVTIDIQSMWFVDWTVTNANNLMAETGTGYDLAGWVSVSPAGVIDEVATGVDLITGDTFTVVDEQGSGVDAVTVAVTAVSTVDEQASGTGTGFPAVGDVVDEQADGVDTLFGDITLTLAETGTGVSVALDAITTSYTVDEAGTAKDTIVQASSSDVVDEGGFGADFIYASATIDEAVFEFGDGVDDSAVVVVLGGFVGEFATVSDEYLPSNNVVLNYDNVGFGFDDILDSTPTHGAWAFNSRSMAISRWDALRVLEVHEVNGVVYGLAADGLYVLSPAVAAEARADSGLYDFGVIEKKKLRHIYLSYVAQTPLHVGVVHTNGGAKTELVYGKPAYYAESPIQTRVDLGRGPDARYWGIALINTDNGFASVKDMRLVPNVTSRRI